MCTYIPDSPRRFVSFGFVSSFCFSLLFRIHPATITMYQLPAATTKGMMHRVHHFCPKPRQGLLDIPLALITRYYALRKPSRISNGLIIMRFVRSLFAYRRSNFPSLLLFSPAFGEKHSSPFPPSARVDSTRDS